MASQQLNIPATSNIDIMMTAEDEFFSAQVVYTGFASASAINANFKIMISNVADTTKFVDLADSAVTVSDASGSLMFRNEKPVESTYLLLRYTKNSVNAGSFNVYVSPETEIISNG